MLPAVELDGQIITESDDILIALEKAFGVLYLGMQDRRVLPLETVRKSLISSLV